MAADAKEQFVDFVTHLRTVHFTLVALTFALLVASTLAPRANLEVAYEQLSEISEINSNLTRDIVSELFIRHESSVPKSAISIHEMRASLWWKVDDVWHPLKEIASPPPRPMIWIPIGEGAFSPGHIFFPSSFNVDPESRTLRDLIDAWNFLRNGQDAFTVRGVIVEETTFDLWEYVDSTGDRKIRAQQMTMVKPAVDGTDFFTNISVGRRESLSREQFEMTLHISGGKTADPHVDFRRKAVVPIDIQAFPIPLLSDFLRTQDRLVKSGIVGSRRAGFVEAYRDLSRQAEGLESLKLDELRDYLDRVRDETGPQVEVFGAGIPQRVIFVWGTLVLLAVQTYFLCHLVRFKAASWPFRELPRVPWIGIYEDIYSRILSQVSIGFVVIATIVLMGKGWQTVTSDVTVWLLVIAAGLCVGASVACHRVMWRGLRHTRCDETATTQAQSSEESDNDDGKKSPNESLDRSSGSGGDRVEH